MTFQNEKNQEIKRDWISALEQLMAQIKQWISKPQQEGLISIEEQSVEKHEEHLGNYNVPVLFVTTKNNLVEIRPVGRFAIGAIGRVDMTNNKKCFTFLYSSKKGWIYMGNRKPLTKALFYELLETCMEREQASENGDRLH